MFKRARATKLSSIRLAEFPGMERAMTLMRLDNSREIDRAIAQAFGPDDQVLIDERPRGDFTRRLYLGDRLDSERLTADFTNGVLTLTIPVDESSKPRTIPVGSLADSTKADTTPTVPTNA
jgi:HSP20 family protein